MHCLPAGVTYLLWILQHCYISSVSMGRNALNGDLASTMHRATSCHITSRSTGHHRTACTKSDFGMFGFDYTVIVTLDACSCIICHVMESLSLLSAPRINCIAYILTTTAKFKGACYYDNRCSWSVAHASMISPCIMIEALMQFCCVPTRNQRQLGSFVYPQLSCWPTVANTSVAPALVFVALDPGYFDYQVRHNNFQLAVQFMLLFS